MQEADSDSERASAGAERNANHANGDTRTQPPGASLVVRLGLIVVLSLSVSWIGTVLAVHLARLGEALERRPLPSQLSALVELLEQSPHAQRQLLLQAVSSDVLLATLDADTVPDSGNSTPIPLVASMVVRQYLHALGGRPVEVLRWRAPASTADGNRFPLSGVFALDLRIGLATGEVLRVRAKSVSLAALVGMPMGVLTGLVGTLVGVAALIALWSVTRPLVQLAAAVDQLNAVQMAEARICVASKAPEITALVSAFNRLCERLACLVRARMVLLGGLSHDVRSFATRLSLRADCIADETQRKRAKADIKDMVRLLDQAMLASRAIAGGLREELVDIRQLVYAEVIDRRALGRAALWVATEQGSPALVLGDQLALRRIAGNVLDNAIEYGERARVSVLVQGKHVVITVDDDGPGFPPEGREALMEPFVRGDVGRRDSTPGVGLGLAVARTLVEAHQGRLAIADAPGAGARVTVELPLFDPS